MPSAERLAPLQGALSARAGDGGKTNERQGALRRKLRSMNTNTTKFSVDRKRPAKDNHAKQYPTFEVIPQGNLASRGKGIARNQLVSRSGRVQRTRSRTSAAGGARPVGARVGGVRV